MPTLIILWDSVILKAISWLSGPDLWLLNCKVQPSLCLASTWKWIICNQALCIILLFISVGEIFTIENKHFNIQRMNHENNYDLGKSKRSMSLQCLKQFSWEGLPLHKEVGWEPLLTCMSLSLFLAGSFTFSSAALTGGQDYRESQEEINACFGWEKGGWWWKERNWKTPTVVIFPESFRIWQTVRVVH